MSVFLPNIAFMIGDLFMFILLCSHKSNTNHETQNNTSRTKHATTQNNTTRNNTKQNNETAQNTITTTTKIKHKTQKHDNTKHKPTERHCRFHGSELRCAQCDRTKLQSRSLWQRHSLCCLLGCDTRARRRACLRCRSGQRRFASVSPLLCCFCHSKSDKIECSRSLCYFFHSKSDKIECRHSIGVDEGEVRGTTGLDLDTVLSDAKSYFDVGQTALCGVPEDLSRAPTVVEVKKDGHNTELLKSKNRGKYVVIDFAKDAAQKEQAKWDALWLGGVWALVFGCCCGCFAYYDVIWGFDCCGACVGLDDEVIEQRLRNAKKHKKEDERRLRAKAKLTYAQHERIETRKYFDDNGILKTSTCRFGVAPWLAHALHTRNTKHANETKV